MANIRVTVWGENVHERKSEIVRSLYPQGMHQCIADALNAAGGISATTATLDQPDHGLPPGRLEETDVLIWWGHAAHGEVRDEIVERVTQAVWSGMGAIFLHSAHFSKLFKRLMGTPCNLTWREAGERERLWLTSRSHPIAAGLPDHFELENEEMYGEPFGIPDPMETVFVSWFQGGEVFRSGVTYKRGAGRVSTPAARVTPGMAANASAWLFAMPPVPRMSSRTVTGTPLPPRRAAWVRVR